jgi:hypothetical protein
MENGKMEKAIIVVEKGLLIRAHGKQVIVDTTKYFVCTLNLSVRNKLSNHRFAVTFTVLNQLRITVIVVI